MPGSAATTTVGRVQTAPRPMAEGTQHNVAPAALARRQDDHQATSISGLFSHAQSCTDPVVPRYSRPEQLPGMCDIARPAGRALRQHVGAREHPGASAAAATPAPPGTGPRRNSWRISATAPGRPRSRAVPPTAIPRPGRRSWPASRPPRLPGAGRSPAPSAARSRCAAGQADQQQCIMVAAPNSDRAIPNSSGKFTDSPEVDQRGRRGSGRLVEVGTGGCTGAGPCSRSSPGAGPDQHHGRPCPAGPAAGSGRDELGRPRPTADRAG